MVRIWRSPAERRPQEGGDGAVAPKWLDQRGSLRPGLARGCASGLALSRLLVQPSEIAATPTGDRKRDDLGDFVRMLAADECFQRRKSNLGGFENDQHLPARLDLSFPPVVGLNLRKHLRAGTAPRLHRRAGKLTSHDTIGSCHENCDMPLGLLHALPEYIHLLGRTQTRPGLVTSCPQLRSGSSYLFQASVQPKRFRRIRIDQTSPPNPPPHSLQGRLVPPPPG